MRIKYRKFASATSVQCDISDLPTHACREAAEDSDAETELERLRARQRHLEKVVGNLLKRKAFAGELSVDELFEVLDFSVEDVEYV